MTYLTAVVLGLIQGVAEFLPISSSGHLAILQNFLKLGETEEHLFFDVLLHLGTLVAVIIAYWRDVRGVVREGLCMLHLKKLPRGQKPDRLTRRMILFLIFATLPLVFAVFFKDAVESLYANTFFIGFALVATGFLLFAADRWGHGNKNARSATIFDALVVGVSQMVAVVPGLSRSGTTISAGMLRGFDRSFAVQFSFLLSIPAVLGANLLSLIDAVRAGINWSYVPMYLVGVAVAFVSGYLAIYFLRVIVQRGKFGGFAYYCWGVGLLTLILSLVS
ncbi:MAG: undecaprenyl-diphosphate phosphatase [Oscillospiraceae bacterium]